ncbi:MAG TPA: RNA chaperone Hfq [Candidatus Polarisedimenticolaceae bacterium]|nr:RNA chaperone Hfq [Candidatus Polarisedimenticolaceae bacterium]
MVNRKLVRPNLAQLKERMSAAPHVQPGEATRDAGGSVSRRRTAPPDATAAEAFYYLKQMNQKTPMVVVLDDGEQLRGHIEWYDKSCIKVHREGSPNLLVFKHSIRYMYKQEEEGAGHTND